MRGQKEILVVSVAVALLGGLAACSGAPPAPAGAPGAPGASGAPSAAAPDPKAPEASAAKKERTAADCLTVGEPAAPAGPAIGGQARKDLLASMMQTHRDKFRCCYDVARRQNASLKGSFQIEFQLKPDGSITSVATNREKSEIKDDAMDSCAVAVGKTFHFPASAEGKESTVPYPYTFTPRGNAGP
jgi:hypothetical protein